MSTITTPIKQREAAVKAARTNGKPKGKTATARPGAAKKSTSGKQDVQTVKVTRWRDTAGVDLVKGLRVRGDGADATIIGTVAYRHTHEIDGKSVGMIGVSLTKPAKVGGRTVKNRSFRADELTAVPE